MKTQRLDWMKFFVADFMTSEAVEVMSDAEVGQYCLLMFTAWLGGKDCTLPNDARYLARHARCENVSAAVMAKFTQTPEARLVNEVQQKIYREQLGNFETARAKGQKGRAKQLGRSPKPDSAPTQPGNSPDDKNGNDKNGIEKIGYDENVNGAGSQSHTSIQKPSSHSFLQTGIKHSAFAYAELVSLNPDNIGSSREEKLATIFWSVLPDSGREAAPKTWEKLWAEDFAQLGNEPWDDILGVIDFSQISKWKKFVVRAKVFVEKYAEMKEQWLKVRNRLTPEKAQAMIGGTLVDQL
jgi:uncharacterized protein YdaU (DUF1376 family)